MSSKGPWRDKYKIKYPKDTVWIFRTTIKDPIGKLVAWLRGRKQCRRRESPTQSV